MINVRMLKLCGELICQFNCWIFPYFCQNYQKLRFKWLATNSSLIGTISEAFFKLTKFPVAIVSGGEDKAFLHISWSHDQSVMWLGWWDTLTLNQNVQQKSNKSNRTQQQKYMYITDWGKLVLQIEAALFYYKLEQPLWRNREVIPNWGKIYYKLEQVLQIRAIIRN